MANDLILIVDADERSRGLLEVSLKKAGYQLQIFEKGRDALSWLEEVQEDLPSLIISDTSLPGMDGFTFCARVKENLDWEELPFLFLTDADASEDKRRGFELGVEDYLTRPIYVKEITTRVQLLLQRREKQLLAFADAEEVHGALGDVTLIDLLQTVDQHQRTGVIELQSEDRRGVLYCRDGRVVDAAVGKLRGAPAIYRLMQWPQGTYTVRYADAVRRRDAVGIPTRDLLLEGMKELDRWEEAAQGRDLTRIFEVNYRKLVDHLRDLPDEVNAVIRLFDGYRTLQDVVDDSALAPTDTLQVVDKLQDRELIRDVTPEDRGGDLVAELGAQGDSLNDWLGTEAAETLGSRDAHREPPEETEAQKVRRRRQERKRRKRDAKRKATGQDNARLGTSSSQERASQRLQARDGDGGQPAQDPEAQRLRAEIEALEARATELRRQTQELAAVRTGAAAGLALSQADQATVAQEPESEEARLLRARLEEARLENERLEAERLAAEQAAQEAAEAEARRQAELARQEAQETARREAQAAQEAAEAEARRQAEAQVREEEARLEAMRREFEVAALKAREEAARLTAEREAIRAETERKSKEAAEQKARQEAERKIKEEAAARLREEEARLEAARRELEEAKRQAQEEADRLEAERQAALKDEEDKAQAAADAKAKEEAAAAAAAAAAKAKEEADAKAAADAKAKEEADAKAAADAKAKEEADAKAAADAKAKEEADAEAKEDDALAPTMVMAAPAVAAAIAAKDEETAEDEAAPVAPASPEDAFFSQPAQDGAEAPYYDPPPEEKGRNNLVVGLVVLAVLALIGGVAYFNKSDKGGKPSKPPVAKADAGQGAGAATDKADAGAAQEADAKEEVAQADAATPEEDAGDQVAPEQLQAARQRASELIFGTTMERLAFHPDTGEPMVAPKDGEPKIIDLDDKKPAVANGGAKPAPRKDNGAAAPAPAGPKETVKIDDASQERDFKKHLAAGKRLARSRQFDKAVAELRKAEAIQAGSSQVNYWLGYSYYNKAQFNKAVSYLERVVRVNGSNAQAVQMLGDSYQATGNRSKAVDAYKKYLALRPTGKTSDQIRRIIAQYH